MTANVDGVVAVVSHFEPDSGRPPRTSSTSSPSRCSYWPLLLMAYSMFSIMIVSLIGWWALSRVLERLRGIPDVHKLESPPTRPARRSHRFRCGCATSGSATPTPTHDALAPLSLTVDAANTSRSPAPTVPARRR